MNADEVERALDDLGSDLSIPESQAAAEARRRRVVSHMQRTNAELVREGQKVRFLRWGVGGGVAVSAAAVVTLSFFGPLASSSLESDPGRAASAARAPHVPLRTEMTKGGVTRMTGKAKERLGLGDSLVLEEAQVLETEEGSHARVHGGRGLDIDVGPGSRVVVGAVSPETGAARIQLQRGLVSCSVDPSGEGPKLAVVTPDATVEVKGTIFSVEVTDEDGSIRSCVRVQRGWVTVVRKGETEQVRSGQSSGCDVPETDEEFSQPSEAEELGEEISPASAKRPTAARTNASEAGLPSIALQNSLLARALASERNGDLDAAERELSQLLHRFPSTPLRVDAEAARARILKRRSETKP